MKKILFSLLFIGFMFAQSNLGSIDGTVKMQNEVIDNLSYGGDAALNIATGTVTGVRGVNVSGVAPGVQNVTSDIWDLADDSPTQSVWLAPTAARLHAVVSTDSTDAAAASIFILSANITTTKTVTIDTKVYTFQGTLTDVDGNVHIGSDASDTIDNFIAAINLTGTAGTDYALSMTAPAVTMLATVADGDTMNVYMDTDDTSIATTENDDNAAWTAATVVLGTGARTIQIWGLKTWATEETSEVMYLRGVFPQNTDNSYVMINKMRVLTNGATNLNKGAITATSASDSKVTAAILADQGKTQMAIYGIPSTQTAYVTGDWASFNEAGGLVVYATVEILINRHPDDEPTKFTSCHTLAIQSLGKSYIMHGHNPYHKVVGPAIIKLNAIGSAVDLAVSGGFGLYLVDN